MPQFDIFFYFNAIFYFLVSFITLYFVMSFILLPRVLAVLKLRHQKLMFLYKISFLSKLRFAQVDNIFFAKNLKVVSSAVRSIFLVIGGFFKKQ